MDKSEEAQKLFECGMEAYRAKDYTKALTLLKQAAELGHVFAMYKLSRIYSRESKSESLRYLQMAAENNYTRAMVVLGNHYYYTQKNLVLAFQWYYKAAELGDKTAIENVARSYIDGTGVQKNLVLAFQWYYKAAELGDKTAIENVARSYIDGTGVQKSGEKALEWYKKIAYYPTKYPRSDKHRVNREIILEIAKIYRDGIGGVKSDGEEAVKWLREIEDSKIVQLIAEIYRDGLGLPADGEKAIAEFKKLMYSSVLYPYGECTAKACLCIARIYRDGVGNIQQNNKEYLKWLRKATGPFVSYFQSYPFYNRDAMIELGDVYRDGILVRKKDCNKALYYYKEIFDCYHDDIEDSEIALRIADIYSKGIGGVKKNPKEAEKYLMWAKELNPSIDEISSSEEKNEQ